MFIGPCIIVIFEEWKTNLMSLAILFHFLCAQHVSDINISIFRSLRLCCWITTSVVLFSFRCVLEVWCGWFWVVLVFQADAQLLGFEIANLVKCYIIYRGAPSRQHSRCIIQGDSVARGLKLLSIKNYVIEIMTWKFIYTYRERCKTGPAYNRCWNWSPFTSKHTWMRFSKFWNTFPKFV